MNFDPLAGLQRWFGLARGVIGGVLALVAFRVDSSVVAGIAWSCVLAIAAFGAGVVFERIVRTRVSTILALVSGLALLLVVSTALGGIGVLTRDIQLVIVGVGVASNAIPRLAHLSHAGRAALGMTPQHDEPSWPLLAIAIGLALVMLAIPFVLLETSIEDGFDHTFVVKRLWDTGKLFPIFHQAGASVVGESLLALPIGAQAASAFESGFAPGLLLVMLAITIGGRDTLRTTAFLLFAIPIALAPMASPEWSGTVLHVATFVALTEALRSGHRSAHVVLLAIALATIRHEYVVLALPYLAAGLVLPQRARLSRRAIATAVVLWIAILVPFQIVLAVEPTRAVIHAVVLLVCIPSTALVVACSSDQRSRPRVPDAFAVLTFASLSLAAAVVLEAIRPAQHGESAAFTGAIALVAGFAITLLDRRATESALAPASLAVTAIVVVGFLGVTVLPTTLDYEDRDRISRRWHRAIIAFDHARAVGIDVATDDGIRALQDHVPPRARVGFWGLAAARLDFTRHAVRDISWPPGPRRARYFLMPLQQSSLRRLDYVIVENIEAASLLDPWDTERPATTFVEARLQLVAANEHGQVFRVVD